MVQAKVCGKFQHLVVWQHSSFCAYARCCVCRRLATHSHNKRFHTPRDSEFLNSPAIVEFAKENPQINITVKERRNKHPHIVATYADAARPHVNDLRNCTMNGVLPVLNRLRNRTGRDQAKLRRWVRPQSATRSVQGQWSYASFINQGLGLPPPVMRQPAERVSKPVRKFPTVTPGSILTATKRKGKKHQVYKFVPNDDKK